MDENHAHPAKNRSRRASSAPKPPGEEFLAETLRVWESEAGEQLTLDDAREIRDNMARYIDILQEWSQRDTEIKQSK
ncbi:hypothetical protein ACFL2Z_01005 [Candidatus Eisenbacteria bacterium]|uniref:Uncharacterized protein n=1 Tax=Eiseniibacteriota bacterium TaxID=2212470 RepID=A0ABV6YN33_UNCEI